jgi:hypothetical protein
MSDRYPPHRSPIRQTGPLSTVVGTFTINGYDGELRGRAQLGDSMVIGNANDGSPLVILDVTRMCVIDKVEGCVRCTTPRGSFRSNDPVWIRWSQEVTEVAASSHDDRSYRVDHRQTSSDSSGLLPAHVRRQQSSSDSSGILQAMPHRLGLSGIGSLLSRWRPWQLVVAAGVALLLLLIALVLLGLLAVWGFGLVRSHGGEWFKQLPIPVESTS